MSYRKYLFTALIAGALMATSASADIIHVDAGATGNNDGISWEHAFTDLQDALSGAEGGDEIRVAAGVYTPGGNQTDTFHLINGVAIYGGFPPGGGEWEDRDWAAHETILSGDINGSGNLVGNSYHVVTGSNTDLPPCSTVSPSPAGTRTTSLASTRAAESATGKMAHPN